MADLLTLTWASDNEAVADTLNLLDFVSGYTLADNGWIPRIMEASDNTATETLTFRAKATSHDRLADNLQLLDDWITRINVANDPVQRRTVWLNARWKSETETRRAMIYTLSYSINSSPFGPFLRDDSFMPEFIIVIQRGHWEELTQRAISTVTDSNPLISNLGGKAFFVDDPAKTAITVSGDIPARIAKATLQHTFTEREIWVGFKTSRYGDPTNFIPTWDAKLGTVVDADTSVVVDAGANSGQAVQTTFAADASLIRRLNIITANVSLLANVESFRGRFAVLGRMKVSAGVARARISYGLSTLSASRITRTNPRVSVSTTSYKLYDMGTIELPAMPHRYEIDNTVIGASSILFDAERVSGAGSLSLDCFVLIPIAEGFFKVLFDADTDVLTTVRVDPNGTVFTYESLAISALPSTDSINWSLPANDESPLVVIASQGTSHTIATSDSVSLSYIRRWRSLRGNE